MNIMKWFSRKKKTEQRKPQFGYQQNLFWVCLDSNGDYGVFDTEGNEILASVKIQITQDWGHDPGTAARGSAFVKHEFFANVAANKEEMMKQIGQWKEGHASLEATRTHVDGMPTSLLQGYWHRVNEMCEKNPNDPRNADRKKLMAYIDKKICERTGKPYPAS